MGVTRLSKFGVNKPNSGAREQELLNVSIFTIAGSFLYAKNLAKYCVDVPKEVLSHVGYFQRTGKQTTYILCFEYFLSCLCQATGEMATSGRILNRFASNYLDSYTILRFAQPFNRLQPLARSSKSDVTTMTDSRFISEAVVDTSALNAGPCYRYGAYQIAETATAAFLDGWFVFVGCFQNTFCSPCCAF